MSGSRTDVLVVDDSVTDLRVLMDLMTLRDLRFSIAQDGERGYQLATALQPGLILLDVNMPRMNGYAMCRRLKSNPLTVSIPVIFLTAETDLDERLKGFAVGGVDFISKPFEAQEVLARVGVHLELAVRRTRIIEATLSAERVAESHRGEEAKGSSSLDEVLVAAAQKILRNNLANPPSLEDLAHQVGSNRRRLNEAFQALCGLPVFGWLREERLRRAHEMVTRSEASVSVISDFLGYSTPANFTKAFREHFGCTPTELREGLSPRGD